MRQKNSNVEVSWELPDDGDCLGKIAFVKTSILCDY